MTHSSSQPGLHIHSHDPAEDLIKQFRVDQRCTRHPKTKKPMGWLARKSFHTEVAAKVWVTQRLFDNHESEINLDNVYRIVDQSVYPELVISEGGLSND